MRESNNGITQLMSAAHSGDFEALLSELAEGGDVNACDIFGNTALAYAAMAGHCRIVWALLMMGADADAKNQIGMTPHSLAASRRHIWVERMLARYSEGVGPEGLEEGIERGPKMT